MTLVMAITGDSVFWLLASAFFIAGAATGYRSGGIDEPFFLGMGACAVVALLFAFEVFPPQ